MLLFLIQYETNNNETKKEKRMTMTILMRRTMSSIHKTTTHAPFFIKNHFCHMHNNKSNSSSNSSNSGSSDHVRVFWDKVSTEYSQSFFGTFSSLFANQMLQMSQIMIPSTQQHTDKRIIISVLDVGAGTGAICNSIANQVQILNVQNMFNILATDISPEMIHQLNTVIESSSFHSKNQMITTKVLDGMHLTKELNEDYFDYIFANFSLMFFPDRIKGLTEMYKVLKPSSSVWISGWTSIEKNPVIIALYTAMAQLSKSSLDSVIEKYVQNFSLGNVDQFRSEMELAGFKNVSVVEYEFKVSTVDSASYTDNTSPFSQLMTIGQNEAVEGTIATTATTTTTTTTKSRQQQLVDKFVDMAVKSIRWRYLLDKDMPQEKKDLKLKSFEQYCRQVIQPLIESDQFVVRANIGTGVK